MRQVISVSLFVIFGIILSACQEKIAEYEDPSRPYNRQAICDKLTEILKDYDSPNDYKNKPISRGQLAKYYKDYKVYGCEK